MSDLKKLMNKIKKETPLKEEKELIKEKEKIVEEESVLENEKEEVNETPTKTEKVVEDHAEEEKPTHEMSIENEVALLQNDGVFRRELIFALKELVDVHKANTQTLIDIKKKLIE